MKRLIFLLLVLSLGSGISFGYLEPKMFCQINKQNIKISLNATDGLSCESYITYIENTMRSTARNLIVIQWYIVNRQDVDYWQRIKQQKLAEIDKLQGIRLNIISSMKTFESNLLQKTIDYFVQRTASYKLKLQRNYTSILNYTWIIPPNLFEYKNFLFAQIETLTKISQVKKIEDIIPLLDEYVYLKKQLTWISE